MHYLLSGGRQPVDEHEVLLDQLHVARERRVGRRLFQREVKQIRVVSVQYDVGTADGAAEQIRHVKHGIVEETAVRLYPIAQVCVRGEEIRDFLPQLVVRHVHAQHAVVDFVQRRFRVLDRDRLRSHVHGFQRPVLHYGNLNEKTESE